MTTTLYLTLRDLLCHPDTKRVIQMFQKGTGKPQEYPKIIDALKQYGLLEEPSLGTTVLSDKFRDALGKRQFDFTALSTEDVEFIAARWMPECVATKQHT
jgi:hypothetical protein